MELYSFFVLLIIAGTFSAQGEIPTISPWLKETAKLWSEEKIGDDSFLQSVQYMIKNNVIKITFEENLGKAYFLPNYGQESFVSISGTTGDLKKTGYVFLTIIRPDGEIINSKASVLESGFYQTIIILEHDFPTGVYKIIGTFEGVEIPISYFHVKKSVDTSIPFWIKNNAKWWADNKISDGDYILGLQYMINHNILQIEYDFEKISKKLIIGVDGLSSVRRGTMQSIEVTVTDGQMPVKNAIVLVRVEDYGENILEDFHGNTNSEGKYAISWEIHKNAEAETLLTFIDVTNGFSSASSIFSFKVTCHCGENDCECR